MSTERLWSKATRTRGYLPRLVKMLKEEQPLAPDDYALLADLLSTHIADAAITREKDWYKAVEDADNGDLSTLVKMFDDGEPLTPWAYALLADLLSRHKLRKLRGGRRAPIYRSMTTAQARLHQAKSMYKSLCEKGASRKKAIEKAAAHWKISENTLANYIDGRGSKHPRVLL